jgi:hypothetical protein
MNFPVFCEPGSPTMRPADLGFDLNPEHSLLGLDMSGDDAAGEHSTKTAPVLTEDALRTLGPSVFPQRASYGRVVEQHVEGMLRKPDLPGMYINTNAPFSALVCGVQVRKSILYVTGRLNIIDRVLARAIRRPFFLRGA